MQRRMQGWTIYQNRRDGQYMTRRWSVVSNGGAQVRHDLQPLYVGSDLEAAREVIPQDACCVGRQPDDDLAVLETWL